ncbi:1-acyl-sn-glycerol-3-phosphate acyltransferase [Arthrobacter sp. ISL-30]|uniref:lysophospholipid acyltransferase family protein n=1 Tax=Arthrobacter sp. ISL-30 TaxID=2819109 RepID=UPI001BEB5450|nr:lysophospholipid acyltransferase family protein [Arthrobacter sp. ISL-30]MBT2512040.1 1-acyl-sn-glycerol-3-phosphate acyltransferase [Arthrobacter sp. ISL-30]
MAWSRLVGWLLANVAYRTSVTGKANIPTGGPVIFAANHISLLDGPVMFGVAPRSMHILVKKEMFRGFLGRVLRASGQIAVDRSGDRAALHMGKKLLDAGRCVGILPEGTRGSGTAGAISSGVAWLALNSGAQVVPVAILGTRSGEEHRDALPPLGRRFHVSFGPSLAVGRRTGESGRVSMDRAADEIRKALASHIQDAVSLTRQALPSVPATGGGQPQERHTEVAGTPADHH